MSTAAEPIFGVKDRMLPTPGHGPRVLFLIDEITRLDGGGTERQVLQIIGLASRLGYQPHLAVLRGGEWLRDENVGCPVYSAEIRSLFRPDGWRGCRRIVRWMRREQFTIMQTFFLESNIIGPWMARRAGVPLVLGTQRNLDPWHDHSAGLRLLGRGVQRLGNRYIDCMVVNSQMVADTLMQKRGVPPSKLRIAYNGIDLSAFAGVEQLRSQTRRFLQVGDGEVLVGNVSCMRPVKGLTHFVEAARLVLATDPTIRFVLVGDGEQEQVIAGLVRRYGIESQFHLVGAHLDVRPFLAAMDIGVLSSLAEGFSNSLLEYMAAGLPVVATDVGGNAEALGRGQFGDNAGLLVPAADPKVLAKAILDLRSEPLRRQMAAAARRRVQRFSLERAEVHMQALYTDLLDAKGIARPKFLKEK